jgi:PAT family beta-lactamase induction signal transducer AmpG
LSVILILGFASGLPLALTGATLQAWVTVEGVDLATIGLLTLVGIPYTWKFLWSPLLDRFVPPFLGRRRGWLVVTQLALAAVSPRWPFCSPRAEIATLAALAVFVAFASASQDIVFDAYRTDVARPEERGLAAAMTVVGYRSRDAHLGRDGPRSRRGYRRVAGAQLEEHVSLDGRRSWRSVSSRHSGETSRRSGAGAAHPRGSGGRAAARVLLAPRGMGDPPRDRALQAGDAFAGALTTAFLLRGAGFGLDDVAYVNKVMGLAATIVGAVAGGALMVRLGLYRALMAFGILQAVSNLTFMWLALAGKSYAIMILAVGFENFSGGMGTAAFVALLMALCDHRFTATQYALLSALASVGRVYVGPAAGYATDPRYLGLDWATFFFMTFVVALPGLALLHWKRTDIQALDRRPDHG